MDKMTHKTRSKRTRDGESIAIRKKSKLTFDNDRPLVRIIDENTIVSASDETVQEEHLQMLDSVKGHLKELTQPTDSSPPDPEWKEEVVSKSEARRLRKESKWTKQVSEMGPKLVVDGRDSALEYLRLWDEDKAKWTFKKKTQFWLLQNMYNKSKVPKTQFKVMLRYLEGLQGHQRELVTERAHQILEQYSEDHTEGDLPTKREYKRAVAILRVLA